MGPLLGSTKLPVHYTSAKEAVREEQHDEIIWQLRSSQLRVKNCCCNHTEKDAQQFQFAITRGTNFMANARNVDSIRKRISGSRNAWCRGDEKWGDLVEYSSEKTTCSHDTPTAAALVAQQDKKSCAFCVKNYAHEECNGVKDPKTRQTLPLKYGRCF